MPFVVTIVVAVLFASYMLIDPSDWLAQLMQLTVMPWDFRAFILVLGIVYVVLAWLAEKYVLPRLAKLIGQTKERFSQTPKPRKAYKVIREEMRT